MLLHRHNTGWENSSSKTLVDIFPSVSALSTISWVSKYAVSLVTQRSSPGGTLRHVALRCVALRDVTARKTTYKYEEHSDFCDTYLYH